MKNATTVEIERVFDAPREKVWRAWSEPADLKKWWGPKDFTAPSIKADFRAGGKYLFCMRGKAGPKEPIRDYWSTGTYREIVPMKKIATTDSFSDEKGNIISAAEQGLPGEWPKELLVTIDFEDTPEGKTKMTLRHEGIPGEMNEPSKQGWNESFDKLAKALA